MTVLPTGPVGHDNREVDPARVSLESRLAAPLGQFAAGVRPNEVAIVGALADALKALKQERDHGLQRTR